MEVMGEEERGGARIRPLHILDKEAVLRDLTFLETFSDAVMPVHVPRNCAARGQLTDRESF